jgi:hypothetical protein
MNASALRSNYALAIQEGKMFFFEKKNQKTFAY